jgi:hypothetical protein
MNLILYCISKYCTGKLQEVGNNMMKRFKYTIYIITYLDIHVTFIQPKEDSSDLDKEVLMWIILGSIYLSDILHSILGYYVIFAHHQISLY